MKILHLADIHIHNSTERYNEYEYVFNELYNYIDENKPERIVISGDLFESFVSVTNEAKIFAGKFLKKLSKRSKVIITPGNHDILKRNKTRTPTTETLTELMDNSNILYLSKSGFFEDGNIMWVNYSHLEKDIIPWEDIKHNKVEDKIYIGLYHDPIYGCKLPNGTTMEKPTLVKIDTFENNDVCLFGDIHIRQLYNKKIGKKSITYAGYSGSLIQQNFGELPENHGGILWDIQDNCNITPIEFNIQSKWVYINEYLNEPDYDDLNYQKSKHSNEFNSIKIHWKDYSVNINLENEQKIRNYFSKLYGCEPDEIKFKKIHLNTSIINSKKLSDKINLNDKNQLQEVFVSYLEENGYNQEQIDELLKIDDDITERLNLNENKISTNWFIEKIWIDNFKSYDKAELNWDGKSGLFQITGKNQQGKTTILDAICYILYGTTLATNKLGGAQREKYSDNKFINYRRKLNYCLGGMIINADGERFIIERKTERTLAKDGSIKTCSTILDFYDGQIGEDFKLTDDRKADTQKKLENIIGEFEDFIRLSLTNSENLNQLLSMDRATFIDSVIKDAGYDIFEKKLDLFKEYKKEKTLEKIVLNLDESNLEVENLTEQIENSNNTIKELIEDENKKSKLIQSKLVQKENKVKTLNKIDENISNINIDDVLVKIEDYNKNIVDILNKQKRNEDIMSTLKSEYDVEKYEFNHNEIKRLKDFNVDFKLKISDYNSGIEKEKSNIKNVDFKIQQLTEREIEQNKNKIVGVNKDIQDLKEEFIRLVESKVNEIKSQIKEYEYKIQNVDNEIENIKKVGGRIKKEIKELEESKICPTCLREFDENHKTHIQSKIDEKNKEIKNLLEEVNNLKLNSKGYSEKIEDLKLKIADFKDKKYDDELKSQHDDIAEKISIKKILIKEIELEISKLEDNNYENSPTLYEKVKEGNELKNKYSKNIKEYEKRIQDLSNNINLNVEKIETLEDETLKLEKDKDEAKTYEKLQQENNEFKLKIENVKLVIENAKNKIDQYNTQLEYIEKNKIILSEIEIIEESIKDIQKENDDIKTKLDSEKSKNIILNKNLEDLNIKIKKYIKQVKQEELFKEYSKIINRDGIPTYLLKQSINLINSQLDQFLNDVDFIVYFDDELRLKLKPKSDLSVESVVLTSSGMERTFAALALKMALRSINNSSKGNILFLDEVTGKLVDESVDMFIELLQSFKTKVDKILIIEHNHSVNPDYTISVKKDKKGISSLVLS